jgi:hypothetical protein
MIRASALKQFNLIYDPAYEPCEDYKLWFELSKRGSIVNTNEVLLKYRVHNNQVSKTRTTEQRKSREAILKEQFELLKIYPSDYELRLHETLEVPPRLMLEPGYLPGLKRWLAKIINANTESPIYNQEILSSYLEKLYEQKQSLYWDKYSTLSPFQKTKFTVKRLIGHFAR